MAAGSVKRIRLAIAVVVLPYLIQATPVHQLLYWIQSGGGTLRRENIQQIADWLQARRLTGLTDFALRGVLNRYYHARLRALLLDGADRPKSEGGNHPGQ